MKDLNRVTRFLWAAALVSLPVTSFRWFPFLGDGALVRPLALYPLALLLPILLIQAIRRQRPFPWTGSVILLGMFAAAAVTVTSLGVLIDPLPLRGQDYPGRALRALVTLVIGLAFFISAAWMNRDEAEVKFTFRWMLVGFGLDLAWSGLQAVTFYTGLLEKEMVTHWQLAFSMRELVRTNRISGLAYEPAWLAGQIVTLYLPILFAALVTKTRLTRTKWLEPVLLALSTLVLLATYSRGGVDLPAGGPRAPARRVDVVLWRVPPRLAVACDDDRRAPRPAGGCGAVPRTEELFPPLVGYFRQNLERIPRRHQRGRA
jgi:hypothetical protein